MAYNQRRLDAYRQLMADGVPFKSTTCPYCTGQRDATVKHQHPSTKPADPWSFWNDVLIRKYAALQSSAARQNMTTPPLFSAQQEDAKSNDEAGVEAKTTAKEDTHASSGAPMFVVGPMVDQSELPFRMLCRQYGATLAYTPMLHAKSFAEGAAYRRHFLTTTPPEEVKTAMERAAAADNSDDVSDTAAAVEGVADTRLVDRPCIVQFCGHDADVVLAAARYAVLGEGAEANMNKANADGPAYPVRVSLNARGLTSGDNKNEAKQGDEAHLLYGCDAVDLNLGCPQGIARRGHYGSFLMEDWELVHTIIHTLHVELEVPVTVKIRVFDHPGHEGSADADTPLKHDFDEALTILYARMIRDAGAQVLCVHGRTRDMKGQQTSVANMELIRRVRVALRGSIPVISNGNVYTYADVVRHLQETRCEGHMCAEPLLWDPTLFANPSHPVMPGRSHGADKATRLSALQTALVYLAWVRRYPVDIGFVKAHLFKMCFHSYELHTEFRDVLGQLKTSGKDTAEGTEPLPLSAVKTSEATAAAATDVFAEYGETEGDALGADDDAAAALASPSAFEHYVDAIAAHLRSLLAAEMACAVEGEQPKAAQAEKAKAREAQVDVWEEEGGLGIDF